MPERRWPRYIMRAVISPVFLLVYAAYLTWEGFQLLLDELQDAWDWWWKKDAD